MPFAVADVVTMGFEHHMLRLVVGRTLVAVPVALLLPVALAGFELIERGQWPTALQPIWGALMRAVLEVGVLVPLVAVLVALVSLRTSRQWLALEQLGHPAYCLMAPMVGVGAVLGLGLGVLLQVGPLPRLYEPTPPRPAREGPVWMLPHSDGRTLWVNPNTMELGEGPTRPYMDVGRVWTRTRAVMLPIQALLVLLCGVGWVHAALSRKEQAAHTTVALTRFVAMATFVVLADVLLGLLVQSGVWVPWQAVVVWGIIWVTALGAVYGVGLGLGSWVWSRWLSRASSSRPR